MPNDTLAEWELIVSAATRLQGILPGAVLVGGTASALYTGHRLSVDADHVLADLSGRFDEVLAQLESVAGWRTARVRRPVQILGSLEGIETGVRQLARAEPLETARVQWHGQELLVPTEAEILRITAVLILKRNATRDYLDFIALAERMGSEQVAGALARFDLLYPQPNDESALQQLQIQLSNPLPFDLEGLDISEYKHLAPRWRDWAEVKAACADCATTLFDRVAELEEGLVHRRGEDAQVAP